MSRGSQRPRPQAVAAAERAIGRAGQRGFVVREIGHFLHVLRMADPVLLVQNENGAALDAQFLDQRAVGGAEGAVLVVGEHLHVVHAEGAAPARLGERQVHAHGDDIHAGQFAPPLR